MSWLLLYTYTMTAIFWIIYICHATISWLTCVHMCICIHTTCSYDLQLLNIGGYIRSLLHLPWPICVVFTYCSSSHPDNRSYIYTHNDLLNFAMVECSHTSLKQASIYTHQCIDTSTHARTYLHNHACIHTYIHTYIHTNIHLYIHTHRHNSRNR